VLLNAKNIDLGEELSKFKSITQDFPPDMKGLAIGNSEVIRRVHNSFARPEQFEISMDLSGAQDAFHFIAYIPINGVLYELDGLKSGPVTLGPCSDDDWLQLVKPEIQKRIETYSAKEIRFNLMGIIRNRKHSYEEQLVVLRKQKAELESKLLTDAMDTEGSNDNVTAQLVTINDEIDKIQGNIANEEAKFQNWKSENIRRKHNYIPFLFHLLKTLAEKDLLVPLIEKAKEKQQKEKK